MFLEKGQSWFLTHSRFPHRPEAITMHRNKTCRSGVGPDLWSLLQCHVRSYYTLHRVMRLKISLIDDQKQGLSEILCPCTKALKEKRRKIFSSQLLPLLFLKLHLITKAGSKEGTGREKPGKREVAKLTRAEFQGVKW